jgi:MSHA pilin protein MshA
MDQKGFTLIELIVIIVILGILAVTAIPKYVDMKTEAEQAAATGVNGGAEGAATMNFAGILLGKAGMVTPLAGADELVDALDGGTPDGWIVSGTGSTSKLCRSAKGVTCDSPGYAILVTSPQTATAKAVLSRTW